MADETEGHVDIDYSRRLRQDPPEGGIVMDLPDGRRVISGGGASLSGKWFVLAKDGWPDWDQPVDIYKELNLERPTDPDHELPQP